MSHNKCCFIRSRLNLLAAVCVYGHRISLADRREGSKGKAPFYSSQTPQPPRPPLLKGALTRILTDFHTAEIYICGIGNLKNDGPFLLTIAILEH